MRRTRKSRGGAYPFQGDPNGNYYPYNQNTLFSPASTRFGGKKRKKKRTRRYSGGFDDRFGLFDSLYNVRDHAVNFWNMTQGSEQIPVGRVLDQPVGNV